MLALYSFVPAAIIALESGLTGGFFFVWPPTAAESDNMPNRTTAAARITSGFSFAERTDKLLSALPLADADR
jgi:hypothetical protein